MKRLKQTIILSLCLSVIISSLTGCGAKEASTKADETEYVESKNISEQSESKTSSNNPHSDDVKEASISEKDRSETVPEKVVEKTPGIVYEGIDMESTLPGNEWIETLVGVIDEPKIVVFNDKTNRKEIVENGKDVSFSDENDYLAIYLPDGAESLLQANASALDGTLTDWAFWEKSQQKHAVLYWMLDPNYIFIGETYIEFLSKTNDAETLLACKILIASESEAPVPTTLPNEIDTSSTLPGMEWVESFAGIVNEPKLVIYNDKTNKKIILENGQNIDFCEGDCFAIFSPESYTNISQDLYRSFAICTLGDYALYFSNPDLPSYDEYGSETIEVIVNHNNTEKSLSCTLNYK